MAHAVQSPPRHRSARHPSVADHRRRRIPWSELHLGVWVAGLLLVTSGSVGLVATESDYPDPPADQTIPALAVLGGGLLVAVAALGTVLVLALRIHRRLGRPSH